MYGNPECGQAAECHDQNHRAVCSCSPGTQGNPFVSCIKGVCQYNEDCADHETCDRLNRFCKPVCDQDVCAKKAYCSGRNHQPVCECHPGLSGNPFVECIQRDLPRPECVSDSECPSKYVCINTKCQDPCAKSDVCSPDQICFVLDSYPLKTVTCRCPSDMITNSAGKCVPIVRDQPQCVHDVDCPDTDKCIRGNCRLACSVDKCGVNAQCISQSHRAICSCPREYIGDPRVECSIEPKTPNIKRPECERDTDCRLDQKCDDERCVNPCKIDDICGRGASCFPQNHQAICQCLPGQSGNPKIACYPPPEDKSHCSSNAECAPSESCINLYCVDPCNCGPNADCTVRNHYPICTCKPGYSGNALVDCVKLECTNDDECPFDKVCSKNKCIHTCIVNDPCPISAECYGQNHRSACRCPPGLEGNPFNRCERVECHSDYECPGNRACIDNHCLDPCKDVPNPPCARNAICHVQNHAAQCRCPEHLPMGNPLAYCEAKPPPAIKEECYFDVDCPSKLACIRNKCVEPCAVIIPCAQSARCSVIDSIPVRTMVCECPELQVPDLNGECRIVALDTPPACTADNDCATDEACINRQCRNPCNCGNHATCVVKDHRAVCSCDEGYEGNPNIGCRVVGCRTDSECDSGKACVNGNCVNPCLIDDPCGRNAECYVYRNRAECRCLSGYRGDPRVVCNVIGCRSNNDCPSDKQCLNTQCVNPCYYENPCSPRAECLAQNHLAQCKCPPGFIGNPYVDCRPEPVPECKYDVDCPSRLACINEQCQDPCAVFEPCNQPARCEVVPSLPVRTMICICPEGYVSSGPATCKPTEPVRPVGCIADTDCPSDRACINSLCRDPCNCGSNAECRIKDHKPVCSCIQGYKGNPEIECSRIGCRSDSECSPTHTCINQQCALACAADGSSCGHNAECYGINHNPVCECPPGLTGDPRITCVHLECTNDDDCPNDKACLNNKCENPCEKTAVCARDEICRVYHHRPECTCLSGFVYDDANGCILLDDRCHSDSECPTQTACIGGECVNPCNATQPCGVNTICRVLDTLPVRTMVCECLPGYQGNAAIQCDKEKPCPIDRGYIIDRYGECVCPPGSALNVNEECVPCREELGYKVDETGHCVCALERGLILDDRGRCICPIEHGYRLTSDGRCIREEPECRFDSDCADYHNCENGVCVDPCLKKTCGINALCNATNHQAVCLCISGYTGNPDVMCNHTNFRTDFPRPDMIVSCLADGVQVEIHLTDTGFNGVLYVKGHSKDEECRRVIDLSRETAPRTEIFKVHFGSCGLHHVNGIASFVLVIQKHPKLVTYKAQAYHIKCVYQTGEQNVTLGFNVQMLTTAGTIANTGPPPTCTMRITTATGQEINSAEIGDNLMLQVEVQPASKYCSSRLYYEF